MKATAYFATSILFAVKRSERDIVEDDSRAWTSWLSLMRAAGSSVTDVDDARPYSEPSLAESTRETTRVMSNEIAKGCPARSSPRALKNAEASVKAPLLMPRENELSRHLHRLE
jgi:hypothetical protein